MKPFLILLFCASILCSCTSGTALLTGTSRPATDPESVQILPEYPAEYEIIGLVTATSDAGWDADGDFQLAREEIRKQAASLGANAVVLEGTNESVEYVYTSGNLLIPSTSHSISGKALYVTDFTPKRTARTSYKKNKMPPLEVETPASKKPSRVINVAIVNIVSNGVVQDNESLYLTNVLREEAMKSLPYSKGFVVMTREDLSTKLPSDIDMNACEGSCLAKVGRDISADYIAQARITSLGESFAFSIELYKSSNSQIISSLNVKCFSVENIEAKIRDKSRSLYYEVMDLERGELDP